MRVLVTGGCGFVGSHVVDELAGSGHEVVVLDRVAPAHRNDRATYVRGDLRDETAWASVLDGVAAVCHQAARVGLGVDFDDVADYAADNDLGTAIGLRALHRSGFSGRIVLASSMVVYGEGRYRCGEHGVVRPGPRLASSLEAGRFEPPCPACGADLAAEAVTEDDTLDPRNVYAATKLHQEHLLAAYGREHGSAVVALRYHNVYGPRMPRNTPYAGVAALFADALAQGVSPRVFEDGRQRRDFVHVRDVARANAAALETSTSGFVAINVASGQPRSVAAMAMAMADAFGAADAPGPVVTGEWRLGDVRHVFASPQRAADVLGWTASERFESGVAELLPSRAG
jgi:dTDP-L-rhamnose 4-epimerase